jgi:Tfp pilus assembly protein PilF
VSLHEIGVCYFEMNQYARALCHFERAIAAKEQGDAHARVNYVSVGRSWQAGGECLVKLGDATAARVWFERSTEANARGDWKAARSY